MKRSTATKQRSSSRIRTERGKRLPFLRENGEWKIDKKGYADQIERDVEQNSQQMDDMINRGRQP